MTQLVIKNLHVEVEGKEILRGINLEINSGEIHALMGPNGNGKSTLLSTIMGHPKYQVTKGSIQINGQDVLEMSVDNRSKAGLFLAMQYPLEIPGIMNSDFLRAAMNAHRESPISLFQFIKQMENTINELGMKEDLAHRFLNEGFSGGEKKRNEIVQMRLLKPSVAMLDEIDSGLDVDALKIVANSIKKAFSETQLGLLIVSHYGRFYDLIEPTHVHIIIGGQIVLSGDQQLAHKIDKEGYDWLINEQGITIENQSESKAAFILGTCGATKKGTYHER